MSATEIESIVSVCAEAREVEATPIPADEALRRLCRAVPSGAWKRGRKCGWGRTHYADPNARGECGNRYEPACGLSIIAAEVRRVGGQNTGGYEVEEGGLWLESDGSLWEVRAVDGSWSNWQGSSSGYTMEWRRYTDRYDLAEVAAKVRAAVEAYRDKCRARRVSGAAEATRLIAALDAAGL